MPERKSSTDAAFTLDSQTPNQAANANLSKFAFVILSDPDEIKELFMAPPDVLHPGEGARVLEPLLGRNSVILLDEKPHLEQRTVTRACRYTPGFEAGETSPSPRRNRPGAAREPGKG